MAACSGTAEKEKEKENRPKLERALPTLFSKVNNVLNVLEILNMARVVKPRKSRPFHSAPPTRSRLLGPFFLQNTFRIWREVDTAIGGVTCSAMVLKRTGTVGRERVALGSRSTSGNNALGR
jgi:hypothetical protein